MKKKKSKKAPVKMPGRQITKSVMAPSRGLGRTTGDRVTLTRNK